jgi:HSP20 family protein
MANFWEKLKKGMGVETPPETEEETKEKEEEKERTKEVSKEKKEEKEKKKIELKTKKIEIPEKKENWLEAEGQLAVDVYQTEDELVVQSTIAGVKNEDLEISIEEDVLTIAGERKQPSDEEREYFVQECFWGRFSRKIILPVEVNVDKAKASLKDGILTVRIPKVAKERKKKILVEG